MTQSKGFFRLTAVLVCASLPIALGIAQEKPSAQSSAPRYKDVSLPIGDRVADLLPRMTLEEKVYQLTGGWDGHVSVIDPTGTYTDETARKALSAEWGEEMKVHAAPRMRFCAMACSAISARRRGSASPAMFMGEALHGFMEYGSTSFPQALGSGQHVGPGPGAACLHRGGDEAGSRGVGQVFAGA
jgi:beta-glucosidase